MIGSRGRALRACPGRWPFAAVAGDRHGSCSSWTRWGPKIPIAETRQLVHNLGVQGPRRSPHGVPTVDRTTWTCARSASGRNGSPA